MSNHFIFSVLVLTVAFSSCKKEDVMGPGGVGNYDAQVIFPIKEGDIWRCDLITYNPYYGTKDQQVVFDTIDAPVMRDDGKEYYSFFWEYYTILDDNTVQVSFNNRDWWGDKYLGEYVWFADVRKIDTMSTINFYSDVGPSKGITIAYPEIVKVNGYDCKRTEIVYFGHEDQYEGKRVSYYSKGVGPVYDVQYWMMAKGNTGNFNEPPVETKTMERYFKRIK